MLREAGAAAAALDSLRRPFSPFSKAPVQARQPAPLNRP
jgi:hypothetical protein